MGGSVFSRYFDVFTARPGRPTLIVMVGSQSQESRPWSYRRAACGSTTTLPAVIPAIMRRSGPPSDLEVSIRDATTGEDVPIRLKLAVGAASKERSDFARTYIGRVEITHAGRYRVTARLPNPQPDDPHLSLGA